MASRQRELLYANTLRATGPKRKPPQLPSLAEVGRSVRWLVSNCKSLMELNIVALCGSPLGFSSLPLNLTHFWPMPNILGIIGYVPCNCANASLTLELNATPESRRRVAVTEKKSSVDNDGNMNDLNRSIRGQSLHERTKNIAQVKRGLVASPIGPRRKKGIPKPEKLKWQTFVSVVTKICLLLVAVLWLGQLIWRWKDMITYNRDFSSLDSESRLFEVETSMKSVAKMLQVQVDVVEKKIGTEVGMAKRELKRQVEEKDLMFEEELKRLVSHTDNLDKSLAELKGMGFLSKDEFQTYLDKSKGRNFGSSNHDVTLDDIRNFAKEIVKKEIEKHAADGLGRVDYALSSGGARVISHSEPFVVGKFSNWLALGKGRNRVHSNAQKMLEPSFGEPGQCFALQGNNGFVEIRLRTGVVPEAVTLEHVSKVRSFILVSLLLLLKY
ncbi:hypothetical protein BHE74_00010817 [Ensete ventricosum]|nr:hypothetical protein BHE74_00010817 [Ensete ventricosum]